VVLLVARKKEEMKTPLRGIVSNQVFILCA
jgi:hypothetical protein